MDKMGDTAHNFVCPKRDLKQSGNKKEIQLNELNRYWGENEKLQGS